MGKALARYVHETPMDHGPIPGKLFLHSSGVEVFYRGPGKFVHNDWQTEMCVKEAGAFAIAQLTRDCYFLVESAFTLGILRGHIDGFGQERILDLFVFGAPNNIPDNLWESDNFGYTILQNCNGIWGNNHTSADGALIREDSLIILGREAVNRRTTRGLEEYMKSHACLMDMEPCEQYRSLKI